MRMNLDNIHHEFRIRHTINEAVILTCQWIINEKIGSVESIRWVEEDDDLDLTACIQLSVGHRPRMVYPIIISSTQSYKVRYFCTHTKYHSLRTLFAYLKTQVEALNDWALKS